MVSHRSFQIVLAISLLASSAAILRTAEAAPTDTADFASRCAGCHSVQAGKNGVGPSLAGIYGSTSGTVPGYTFSQALKNAKIVWDDQTLDKFLRSPAGLVHGTKMFANVPDTATRQHIIAYLQTLKPQADAAK